ncbi:ParB N-terminal domain-containing protein [Cellulomonas sp. HZM]|uniref:ParB/RepB/Spo0J family partition protein n=1 Tax=Cellulomonas sp. HZM TaxID=1454010 RepID=UPI000493A0E8|nr:ParB N-terminal domain-containing protein [Cellulomonas sp. HZM]
MPTKRTTVPAPATSSTSSTALDALTATPPTHAPALERVEVDPRTLTLDTNARSELKLTADFKASITENGGVLVPLLCRRDPLGQLLVVDGQRRLVAALELDLPTVPIALLPPVGDDEARLWDQLVTNDQREPLTAAETAAAFQQLSLMGRSAESIAKRARVRQDVVETALAVAGSKAATKVAAKNPNMTLDQLATLAEFDDDATVVKDLTKLAPEPGKFAHAASAAREARAEREAIATFVATLPEGTRVIADSEWGYDDRLDGLLDKAGGKQLTPANHKHCPGHAVYVGATREWSDGRRRVTGAHGVYVCTTWKKAGHVNKYAQPSSGATSGPQSEEQKAERRALIANNKAADAAEPVRTAFIRELLQRKALPKDAGQYVAQVLWFGRADSPGGDAHTLARAFLYGDKDVRDVDVETDLTRPEPAMRYLVALAAAHVEGHMPRDFWHKRQTWFAHLRVVHLRQLEAWGYTLSDVEQLAVATHGKAGA